MKESSGVDRDGEVLAAGSRSVVRAWGEGTVAKVPKPGVPGSWIRHEAQFTQAVWLLGLPAHRSHGVELVNGTTVSIYERVDGPTLWSRMAAAPADAVRHGRFLGALHAQILSGAPPVTLPRQADRLRCKLRRACASFDLDPEAVTAALPPLDPGLRLCHGDFHPGNVIMGAGGPVLVDWFDAGRGHPVSDIARTSLLLGAAQEDTGHVEHLPGHTPGHLRQVHDAYLATVCHRLDVDPTLVARWRRVEAVARLAEGLAPASLLALWRSPA